MILVGNTILEGHEGAAVHQVVADMSLKLKSSKKVEKGWKVLNVLHRVCKNWNFEEKAWKIEIVTPVD